MESIKSIVSKITNFVNESQHAHNLNIDVKDIDLEDKEHLRIMSMEILDSLLDEVDVSITDGSKVLYDLYNGEDNMISVKAKGTGEEFLADYSQEAMEEILHDIKTSLEEDKEN